MITTTEPGHGRTSIRVMTYNILNGGERRENHIQEVIQAARPDVVVLQEVFTGDFLRVLAQSLEMEYFLGTGNAKHKVSLLSRFPIRTPASHHQAPPIWRNFIDVVIEYAPQRMFRLLGVHPIPNLGVLWELWRLWEAQHVIQHYRQYAHSPLLIAGDFNAIAPGDRIRTDTMPAWLKTILLLQGNRAYSFSIRAYLAAGLTDCFRYLHATEDGFTLPPPCPNTRLDYIFVNSPMKAFLVECWVVREPRAVLEASDHYPVMAEFRFDAESSESQVR